ncbi:MAG: branched-chain amino acid ABC transporter permease [Candidatus Nezhaarchaeales archaeon]
MVDISVILDPIIIGLASGTIYGVMALGFVLIYRVGKLVNIAVGDMVLMGAYLVMAFGELRLIGNPVGNLIFALILASLLYMVFAIATERGLMRPLYGQSILSLIMMTVALGLFLRGITILLWGTTLRVFPEQHVVFPPIPITIGPIHLPYVYVWSISGSIIIFGFFFYMFRKTLFGFAMRAVSLEPEAAAAHGISIKKIYTYSWMIAYVAAALAGLVLGAINGINIIISDLGLSRALPAAIIGGIDSPGGALLGGLLLGLLEQTLGTYMNMFIPGIREVIPFIVLLAILVVKPYGLFGTVRIERV